MRKLKKIVSLLLTVVTAFALTTTVFAAETYTISNSDENHNYEVYQIFTGDLKDTTLSNIVWGKNGTKTQGTKVEDSVLNELETVKDGTIQEKLEVIKKYADLTSDEAYGKIEGANSLTEVPAGYYLIKDVDESQEGKDDAYTTYITKIVGDVVITPKSSKPTVDKQVHDEIDDAETEAVDGWGETADHAINETFQFKLIANIPDDEYLDDYETYKFIFTDTMSNGVTFESIASVKINNTPINDYVCTATSNQAGGSWTLTIENLKLYEVDIKGATVEVIYNAHLNENAKIGNNDENKNTVGLEYSNNPNGEGIGKTPEDTVWVFTYQMPNTKVDGDKKPLADAGFRLYKLDGSTEIGLIYDENLKAYRPIKAGETAVEMKSAADGQFNIVGLDAGEYVLKETKTPAGYNTCDPITVTITANHSENDDNVSAITEIKMISTVNIENGSNIIVNNKGSELPETGGIGNYVFYAGGLLLMATAGYYFIKKRKESHV